MAESQIYDTKLIGKSKSGSLVKYPVQLAVSKNRIEFVKSPFALKDDIKSLKGSRWEGFDDPPRKIWSVDNCARNWFQLKYMMGENPYAWFEQPIREHTFERPLLAHQRDLVNRGLTFHYQLFAADLGCGKTLSAIEVIEKSKLFNWWWAAPKSGLRAVEREFNKWGLSDKIKLTVMTYEGLVKLIENWKDEVPDGIVFDEISRLKNPLSQRAKAAQFIADKIREVRGYEGYVIGMSATPAPKMPPDWWSLCEIIWPGFIKEGSRQAFAQRLGIYKTDEGLGGTSFQKLVTWRDDESKCNVCGCFKTSDEHPDDHEWEPSINEVALLSQRLDGLVVVKRQKDCIDIPPITYSVIKCQPSASILRVAKSLVDAAPRAITALNWLRQIGDGFLYREVKNGKETCPTCNGTGLCDYWVDPNDTDKIFSEIEMFDDQYVATLVKEQQTCLSCGGDGEVDRYDRTVKSVPCPKEDVVVDFLSWNEEVGRAVIFAGFTGSIDKCTAICLKQGWKVVQVDGRGWVVKDQSQQINIDPLDFWADMSNEKVVFVAHPQSGGMGLTLIEARMALFYSNDYSPESRQQAIGRIHRIGTTHGVQVFDIFHLPSDERVLEILKSNHRLERMALGDLQECYNDS